MSEFASRAPSTHAARSRGGALDALRFFAALFVVLFHFGDEAPTALRALTPLFDQGFLATDFFLMLSGFVLAKAYGSATASGQMGLGRFWTRRLARSYPTHLITLAILVIMVVVAKAIGSPPSHPENFNMADLPAQILLLHAFGQGGGGWNIPSWTLSALLVCYLFFPALWRGMLRIRRAGTALILGLLVLGVSNLISQAVLGVSQLQLPFEWCLFRAAPLFIVGLCLARAVQTARWSTAQAQFTGLAGATVLLVNASNMGSDMVSVLAICAVVLGCGAAPVGRVIPGAEWGAKVSFSLFMIHTIVGAAWFEVVAPQAERLLPAFQSGVLAWLLWGGALASAVIGAAIYSHWVDQPIQRWLTRRLFKTRARTAKPLVPMESV